MPLIKIGRDFYNPDSIDSVHTEEDGRTIIRMNGGSAHTVRGALAEALLAKLDASAEKVEPAAPPAGAAAPAAPATPTAPAATTPAPAAPSTPGAATGGAK